MNNTEIKAHHYEEIRELVHRKAGIALGESRQALVQARLGKRLRALELDEFEDYIEYLRNDDSGEEIVQLLDVISTNFTSFFREERHFQLLAEIVRKAAAAKAGQFRLWCAAAATGEEPYTLSMVVQEAAEGRIPDIKILATDISTRALRACQAGRYDEARLKTVPEASRRRWFRKERDEFVATPELRAPLRFSRLNLMEEPYPMKGPFDVVFCRNVMIYFDKEGRAKFVRQALRLLAPGGILVVGSSESLAGIAVGMETLMPSVYRKGLA
jgi:chemotaxis protein methyltransferase CheR